MEDKGQLENLLSETQRHLGDSERLLVDHSEKLESEIRLRKQKSKSMDKKLIRLFLSLFISVLYKKIIKTFIIYLFFIFYFLFKFFIALLSLL